MNKIGQHGFIEALLGQGWTTEQIEEAFVHRIEDRKYGLWRAMIRLMTLWVHADDQRREKLMESYSKVASVFLHLNTP